MCAKVLGTEKLRIQKSSEAATESVAASELYLCLRAPGLERSA